MRNAVSAIDPDIERTLDLIRSESGRDGLRGSRRLLAIVAAISLIGLGVIGLSRLGAARDGVVAGPAEEMVEPNPVTTTDEVPRPDEAPLATFAVALHGQGLRAIEPETGEWTMVPFGSPKGDVADLVTRAYGPPTSEDLVADCNGTELLSVDWGGLTLYFAPGVTDPVTAGFLGWDVDSPEPAISTTDGVGFGAPIVMVVASSGGVVQDSTFDWEFFDGAISWASAGQPASSPWI